MTATATAVWSHTQTCLESNLHVKGNGPTLKGTHLPAMDSILVIEARRSKYGGLDFA